MVRYSSFLLMLALLFIAAGALLPATIWANPGPNKLVVETEKAGDGLTVQGIVRVTGIADHPTFRKWQLDLIIDSNETFIALGEESQPDLGVLAEFDTQLYPDGNHKLRLRVVHSNLNYDEYFVDVAFANNGHESIPVDESVQAPAQEVVQATPTPAPVLVLAATTPAVRTPAASTLSGNGLSLSSTTLGGSVPVRGIANHEDFRKWQVDLLLNGIPEQATHLHAGEEAVTSEAELFVFETVHFPNGKHTLRLRVVHNDLNYDEYTLPVVIDQSAAAPAPVSVVQPPRTPGSTWTGGGIRIGPNQRRVIYLTFDDGPHSPYTEQVLDLLAQYNAKATFFVVGRNARGNPDLIKSMYEAGHGIGNHTWSHRNLQGVTQEVFTQEMASTAQTVGKYIASCMRPPYGATDASTHVHAREMGYSVVMWSIETSDWRRPGASTIASRVINQAFPGAIVLLHDGGGNRTQTVAALALILKELTAQGYSFEPFCR
jgi:peptidoglycan-N-acetylglucosamine deacetylase